jgi:rod shape-determining protein MreD
MIKNIVWTLLFALIAMLLQSTVLRRLAFPSPDFTLSILVFSAYMNGSMTGQLTGFFSGLLLDFLSAAPLGLNAFIRTIIGAVMGRIKSVFVFDAVLLPAALCATATSLKALLLFLLSLLFAETVVAYSLTTPVFWIELALNAFTAPFLFALLKLFSSLLIKQKDV